ncbi:MAG: AAA family ATPase, partial [Bacteroidaceae bacterium]|nr:AAA family ATPase [Bacteroidaceae bacterium]
MNVKITSENYAQILESVRIKASDKYSTPPEVIHISDSTISTLGNFSASTGKGKSKKTFNVCAIVASALTGRRVLNYDAKFPEGKRKVLYFDTEQSSYHCHNVLERINRLAGLPINTDSDLIEFLMLREMDALDRRRFIELSLAQRSDIGLVIIDGLRDLLFDINSSSEA